MYQTKLIYKNKTMANFVSSSSSSFL